MAQPKKPKLAGKRAENQAPQEKFLEIARKGKDVWNAWRRDDADERVNFSGVDFTSDDNKEICFAGFVFGDQADFSKAMFDDSPKTYLENPEKSIEQGVSPDGAAIFDAAKFGDSARFAGVVFGDYARFQDTAFGKLANFGSTAFGFGAGFDGAEFGGFARFYGAVFEGGVSFNGATFGEHDSFAGASLGDWARFDGATFTGRAYFNDVNPATVKEDFIGYANYLPTIHKERYLAIMSAVESDGFKEISFSRARFGGVADFSGRKFNDRADFSWARFLQPPDFRGTEKRDNLDWTATHFGLRGKLRGLPTPGWTTDTESATSLRRLRRIANEIHAHDAERDLFILERMAERGITWAEWPQKTAAPLKQWWRMRPWRKSWPPKDLWTAWLARGTWAAIWTPIALVFGFARAMVPTALMFLYRLLSDCGRSVIRPLVWLSVSLIAFGFWYASYIAGPIAGKTYDALVTLTLSNALPFVGSSRQATGGAVNTLFDGAMPDAVYGITLLQGLSSVLLLFLLGLALRTHYKVR